MNNKKIGLTVIVMSVILSLVLFNFIGRIENSVNEAGCYEDKECKNLGAALNYSHLGVGIIFALFSLGIYLIFFSRSEQALFEKLEREKDNLLRDDKLKIISMILDKNEQKIFDVIREKEGITQNMIRIKTDLSKAAVSQVLSNFERRNLIRREPDGKTYSVYLIKDI